VGVDFVSNLTRTNSTAVGELTGGEAAEPINGLSLSIGPAALAGNGSGKLMLNGKMDAKRFDLPMAN